MNSIRLRPASILVLCFVAAIALGVAQAPAASPGAASQPARQVRAIFEVDNLPFLDPKTHEPDYSAVRELSIGDRVTIHLNDEFKTDVRPMLKSDVRSGDRQAVWLDVRVVVPPGSGVDAAKLLNAWRAALRDAVVETGRPELAREQELQRRTEEMVSRLRDEMRGLQDDRDRERRDAGVADISRDTIARRLERLESMQQDLVVSLQGKEARIKAVQDQIARRGRATTATRPADAAVNDAVTEELAKVVKVREEALKRVHDLASIGSVPQNEVSQAEAALAEARVQLITRQTAAPATQQNAELLTALNGELTTTTIDLAELRARYERVQEDLKVMQEHRLLEAADRVQNDIEPQIAALRARMRELQSEVDTMRQRQITAPWPNVTIRELKVDE